MTTFSEYKSDIALLCSDYEHTIKYTEYRQMAVFISGIVTIKNFITHVTYEPKYFYKDTS